MTRIRQNNARSKTVSKRLTGEVMRRPMMMRKIETPATAKGAHRCRSQMVRIRGRTYGVRTLNSEGVTRSMKKMTVIEMTIRAGIRRSEICRCIHSSGLAGLSCSSGTGLMVPLQDYGSDHSTHPSLSFYVISASLWIEERNTQSGSDFTEKRCSS
jgi:hypothetical protein